MTIKAVSRLLALLLALAVGWTATGLAEEAQALDVVIQIEHNSAEQSVAEAVDVPLAVLEGEDETPEPSSGEGQPEESEDMPKGGDTSEGEGGALPALRESSLILGVRESCALTLDNGVSPRDIGATFVSDKPKVATVDQATGVVTAVKKGAAVITMRVEGADVCACAVSVVDAPAWVKLSKSKLTLGRGEERTLKVKLPEDTASAIRFTSSNSKVVSVDAQGHIVALKKGTATITAKTFNRKKAVCKVTVKAAPKSVKFSENSVSLWLGDEHTVKVSFDKNAAGAYSIASSDEGVVSVKGDTLTARGLGEATVTATAYNGLSATMSVQVLHKPVYRALLVGETTFPGTEFSALPGKKDVSLMKAMLNSVKGATGTGWAVTTSIDRTAFEIHNDIEKAFAGAQEGDVSLFYISTHGDEGISFDDDWPEYAGYLMTYPNYNHTNWFDRYTVTLVNLAEWLKAVPGQVIVIIDSCGSGAAVYRSNSADGGARALARFDAAVVSAFRAQDEGVVKNATNSGAFVVQNKFFVLTSAGYQEACYTRKGEYSYFTKWLTDGIAKKGRMPADANKNRLTTLNELYKYIKKRGESTTIEAKGGKSYKQHVQVYPSGSSFGLFYR